MGVAGNVCECVADWPAAGGLDGYLICSPALRGPAAVTILAVMLGLSCCGAVSARCFIDESRRWPSGLTSVGSFRI